MGEQIADQDSFVTRPPSVVRHSFVVRMWRDVGSAGWRVWVQHTRSGEATVAQDLNELLAFVERRAGKLGGTVEKGLK